MRSTRRLDRLSCFMIATLIVAAHALAAQAAHGADSMRVVITNDRNLDFTMYRIVVFRRVELSKGDVPYPETPREDGGGERAGTMRVRGAAAEWRQFQIAGPVQYLDLTEPGDYRFMAIGRTSADTLSHLSEAVCLDVNHPQGHVELKFGETPTLKVRVVDAETKLALPKPWVRLEAEQPLEDGTYPAWSGTRELGFHPLRPGRYRLSAGGEFGVFDRGPFYRARVNVPVEITGDEQTIELELPKAELTAQQQEEYWPFALRGKVTDWHGRPLPGRKINTNHVRPDGAYAWDAGITQTDANGEYALRFRSRPVVPGPVDALCLLSIELIDEPLEREGFGRPRQAFTLDEASQWALKKARRFFPEPKRLHAGRVQRQDFTLPPEEAPYLVEGRVTYADGRPAGGARVHAFHTTGSFSEGDVGYAHADAQGRYSLRLRDWFTGKPGEPRDYPNLPAVVIQIWTQSPQHRGEQSFVLAGPGETGATKRWADHELRLIPRDAPYEVNFRLAEGAELKP